MPKTTLRDWLMHTTTPMRVRAFFDFKVIAMYDFLWRWIFKVKDKYEAGG